MNVQNDEHDQWDEEHKKAVGHILIENVVNHFRLQSYVLLLHLCDVLGRGHVDIHILVLEETRNVVGYDKKGHDEDLHLDVSFRTEARSVQRFADGDVAVGGDENHHPHGAHLNHVRHRPHVRLDVRVDGHQDLLLTERHEHGGDGLHEERRHEEQVVGHSERLEQKRGHVAARVLVQHGEGQRVADQPENAHHDVQGSVDDDKEQSALHRGSWFHFNRL